MKAVSLELDVFRGLFRQTHAGYLARMEAELDGIQKQVQALLEAGEPPSGTLRDLREMLTLLRHAEVKPEKARRKDLRKLEALMEDLKSIVKAWD